VSTAAISPPKRGRGVLIASTYRRLQRFFQHVDLDPDWAVPILAQLIGSTGAWTLALDRTNWKIGTRDVNYLVLAVITRRFRVPLFRVLLDGPGTRSVPCHGPRADATSRRGHIWDAKT